MQIIFCYCDRRASTFDISNFLSHV